jgi:crotonobetaine/carnitine-CoA ligase
MITGNRQRWTVRDVALQQLEAVPERPFISRLGEHPETFATFIGVSAQLANALRACGVGRGSCVAILCPTGLPHLHAWLACGLLGATEVPINPVLRGGALEHVLRTTKPAVALVDRGLLPHLLEAEQAVGCLTHVILVGSGEPADLAGRDVTLLHYDDVLRSQSPKIPDAQVSTADIGSVMFTSGTTGPAKGATMPNGQLCLLALQAQEAMQIRGDDVFYCAHPLNHIAGKYMGIFATFAAGGRVVLDERFEAANWLNRVRASEATLSIAHGPMIEMIAAQPPRPEDSQHALRRLMCCPMPKHLAVDFEARFALRGVEMWGMTEVACPAWTSLNGPRVEGSCGRPLRDYYDLRIVDPETDEELPSGTVGEIVVRPRFPFTTMQGYLGMPNETLDAWRNLWFHTGDAAYLDADDNLFFVDRLKDRIRRRAENISAYDIEIAALAFPPVREAAAVGVPSGFEGDDDIKLCIVPDGPVELAELLAFLAGRLPPFMVPRYIEVLDALPRTPTNKVRKRDLSSAGITAATWDRSKGNIRLRELYGTVQAVSL